MLIAVASVIALQGALDIPGDREKPEDTVKRLIQVVASFHPKPDDGALTQAQTKENAALAKRANDIVDWTVVAQGFLDDHWEKLSRRDQGNFIALLQELFAKVAYPRSAKLFREAALAIENTRWPTLERPVVRCRVEHDEEGMIEIQFALIRHGTHWKLIDVILDGASLARNIRTQMKKIITENSYSELTRRIREKVDEAGPSHAAAEP